MKINFLLPAGVVLLFMTVPVAPGVLVISAKAPDSGVSRMHQSDYAALAKVPPKARAQRNPLEGDAEAVAAGRKLFDQHCAECHGRNLRGGKRGPSLCVVEVQKATPGALFYVLTNGVVRRGMPDWSKLPEPKRWQIVSFLKSLNDGNRSLSLRDISAAKGFIKPWNLGS